MKRVRSFAALVGAIALASPALLGATFAAAQSAREYGSGDICRQPKRDNVNTVMVASGPRAVRCEAYPRGITYHRDNCRWVQEYYSGEYHHFELCQDRGGVWRPSGRG